MSVLNHVCSAGLALLAFSVSLIIGLWVNNPFITVVQRSVFVLVLFYPMGYVLSVLGQKVIKENFDNQFNKSPGQTGETSTNDAAAAKDHRRGVTPA
jgi:hypothetical protein